MQRILLLAATLLAAQFPRKPEICSSWNTVGISQTVHIYFEIYKKAAQVRWLLALSAAPKYRHRLCGGEQKARRSFPGG